ncbi:MAG: hypothetical protein HY291_09790 [Planctomycetes bacterium]|nr:hypothetical protein [Planctomycetota bacterium]
MKSRSLNLMGAGACLTLALCAGCGRPSFLPQKEPPPKPERVEVSAKETAKLNDKDYLMRKATLGSRSERIEAIDVIDRTADPDFLPFLLERLEKEDDRFLQIRIMQALSRPDGFQDVRAVAPIRLIAAKDKSRLGVEAVVALYNLGDDTYMPEVIRMLSWNELYPEYAGMALRALKRIYGVDLPPYVRSWNNYYKTHRLAPYQQLRWYAAIRPPLPPTVAGTTKLEPRPTGGPKLPEEDVKVRRHIVTVYEFWKPDEP